MVFTGNSFLGASDRHMKGEGAELERLLSSLKALRLFAKDVVAR